MKFYQVEAYTGEAWILIPDQTYGCAPNMFRQMLDLLSLLPGQRVKCVGDCLNFPRANGWRPVYLYSVKINTFREWPQNST
jgi:hypothetical protein